VSIDRAAALRNAEKLMRQGKLDAAIAEYVSLVEDAPRDWNVANALGDLYARAGQVDKAIAQFNQIAENLADEGAIAKANAVYKKILKLKPDHEHALLQVADLLAGQGLYADARVHLTAVVEHRRSRGDARGAAQVRIRLGSLDPEDFSARRQAAAARVETGDTAGAVRDLKEIAAGLVERGRAPESLDALREALALDGEDDEVRERLLASSLAVADFSGARAYLATVDEWRRLADAVDAAGDPAGALAVLRDAVLANPDDTRLAADLARRYLAAGDTAGASEYLTAEAAGDDPALRLALADLQIRRGLLDEALEGLDRLLQDDRSTADAVLELGCRLASVAPDAAFSVVDRVAGAAAARTDWDAAASALQRFVAQCPTHVPALMRLVDVSVDGGRDDAVAAAQAQLADAYLASGAAMEARFISDDLLSRAPWEMAHVRRFRQALALVGEADPDRAIADRLSEESPLDEADLRVEPTGFTPSPAEVLDTVPAAGVEATTVLAGAPMVIGAVPPGPTAVRAHAAQGAAAPAGRGQFDLGPNAIDLRAILGDFDAPPPRPVAADEPVAADSRVENVEVDLTAALSEIKRPIVPLVVANPSDLDGVFAHLRGEVTPRAQQDEAAAHYERGLALRENGDVEGAIAALREAARAPGMRFAAASVLGRLLCASDRTYQALDWFEQAAQAPAPTVEEEQNLLYDFADALERVGEPARALAICLELQASAGSYRDVAARIERLTHLQAQG
jgi:tetratricopeptide (TPR) repeat protein